MYKVTAHQGRQGFKDIESEWFQAALNSGRHFLHFPAWYGAQLANLSSDTTIVFVCVRDQNSSLVAILPFEKSTLNIGRFTFPIAQLFYTNEMGVADLFTSIELGTVWPEIKEVLQKVFGQVLLFRLQCIMDGGNVEKLIPTATDIRWTHASKYLNFKEGFDNFFSGYNSKFRNDILKKIKKIEGEGYLRFEMHATKEELDAAFNAFLKVEDSGWKGEAGSSIAKQPIKLAYYRHLLEHFGESGHLRVNLLYLNDTVIAAQLGVLIGERLYLLKIAYNESFGQFSPGALVLYFAIRHLCEESLASSLSFVTGVDWIDRWHPALQKVGITYLSSNAWYSSLAIKALKIMVKRREAKASKHPHPAEQS